MSSWVRRGNQFTKDKHRKPRQQSQASHPGEEWPRWAAAQQTHDQDPALRHSICEAITDHLCIWDQCQHLPLYHWTIANTLVHSQNMTESLVMQVCHPRNLVDYGQMILSLRPIWATKGVQGQPWKQSETMTGNKLRKNWGCHSVAQHAQSLGSIPRTGTKKSKTNKQ